MKEHIMTTRKPKTVLVSPVSDGVVTKEAFEAYQKQVSDLIVEYTEIHDWCGEARAAARAAGLPVPPQILNLYGGINFNALLETSEERSVLNNRVEEAICAHIEEFKAIVATALEEAGVTPTDFIVNTSTVESWEPTDFIVNT